MHLDKRAKKFIITLLATVALVGILAVYFHFHPLNGSVSHSHQMLVVVFTFGFGLASIIGYGDEPVTPSINIFP